MKMSGSDNFALEDCPWLDETTTEALRRVGIVSARDIVAWGPRKIRRLTELDWTACEKVCRQALELVVVNRSKSAFQTAESVYAERKSSGMISTGCNSLDYLLGGGIEIGAVTELYGAGGVGKTQLCYTLAVTVQLPPSKGGLEGCCLYIDSEGTFRPERIAQIARSKSFDPEQVLEKIKVSRAYNSAHLQLLVDEIGSTICQMPEAGQKVKLIIVDSIIGLFRAEYKGREELSERQQTICELLHQLQKLADVYGIAVVITNQIQTCPDSYFGETIKAAGGNVVAHGSTYRIFLKYSGKNRIARMVDSPCHPEREVLFTLSDSGVIDVR